MGHPLSAAPGNYHAPLADAAVPALQADACSVFAGILEYSVTEALEIQSKLREQFSESMFQDGLKALQEALARVHLISVSCRKPFHLLQFKRDRQVGVAR